MTNLIISDHVKSYLVACLVTGIDIQQDKDILMADLVDHMNSTERVYWAQGDGDGIILHDKNDLPLLYLMFNGQRMTFRVFEQDPFTAIETQKEIGLALINIIGFFQANGFEFEASILGSESIKMHSNENTHHNISPEDWVI